MARPEALSIGCRRHIAAEFLGLAASSRAIREAALETRFEQLLPRKRGTVPGLGIDIGPRQGSEPDPSPRAEASAV